MTEAGAAARSYELSPAVVGYVLRYLLDSARAARSARQQLLAQGGDGAANAAAAGEYASATSMLRAAMTLASMIAGCAPSMVAPHLERLMEALATAHDELGDAWAVRYGCALLQQLAPQVKALPLPAAKRVFALLARVLLAPSALPEANWYSAAEAAVAALYTVHPKPGQLMAPILAALSKSALPGAAAMAAAAEGGEGNPTAPPGAAAMASCQPLGHFVFVLGHAALHHLLLIDNLSKAVRQARSAKEKAGLAAAEEAAAHRLAAAAAPTGKGRKAAQPAAAAAAAAAAEADDIASQVGFGTAAADAALDLLKEAVEGEIMAGSSMVGCWGGLVAALAAKPSALAAHPLLRASVLLALPKLMALEASFCEAHMPLLFRLLGHAGLEPGVRNNLVIALGDLAFRFPNVLEPWTGHMYAPLKDGEPGIRKTAIMVLSHLILNDMMKVKGHIAKIALCLIDADQDIAKWAQVGFAQGLTRIAACSLRCFACSALLLAQAAKTPRRPLLLPPLLLLLLPPRRLCLAAPLPLPLRSPPFCSPTFRFPPPDDIRPPHGTQVFFTTLSKKAHRAGNIIYTLLPDMLSMLSAEPSLGPQGFATIMQLLLGFIKQDKYSDSLKEKLCVRFEAVTDPVEWGNLVSSCQEQPKSENCRCHFWQSLAFRAATAAAPWVPTRRPLALLAIDGASACCVANEAF